MRLLPLSLLLLSPVVFGEPPSYSAMFSVDFKASVDAAMAQPTKDKRVPQLLNALRNGTDKEVFFVMPLLFPRPVLDGAKNAGVCITEIDASLATVSAYVDAPRTEQDVFPETHSAKVRRDSDNLVLCLHRFYQDGNLRFPKKR
jgi:hypothetical protein